MTHDEQLKIFQDEAKRVGFDQFLRETNARINVLKENGYTVDQSIELLKLFAMQTTK